jgi:serine/threonine protein kinase
VDVRRPQPGDTIGGCRIERLVGRGGMGMVFRATQSRPERIVALKVISPELADDPAFRARFARESHLAATIEHPNVVPVYAAGEEDGVLYIAMRFVSGVDLAQLRQGAVRLRVERAARIVGQVAAALDEAHSCGLVHRDVKPGNILVVGVEPDEHAYLTDFGLTRRTGESQAMTASGAIVGTIDYMAPEQARGGRVDARTDVYALGCVLHEALSGEVPFPRDGEMARLFAHVNDAPPPLRQTVPELPEAVELAVLRALAKDPDERFKSASDFARAVAAGLHNHPVAITERSVARGAAAPLARVRRQRQPRLSDSATVRRDAARVAGALAQPRAGARDFARRFAVSAVALTPLWAVSYLVGRKL